MPELVTFENAFSIPLKQKLNNPNRRWRKPPKGQTEPNGGTWVFNAGRFHSRTSSQGGNKVKAPSQGYGVRRKSYGPFWWPKVSTVSNAV